MRVNRISSGYQIAKQNRTGKKGDNVSFENKKPGATGNWITKLFAEFWKGWTEACKTLEGSSGSL